MNNKDAYLILAHKVDYTFETLLSLLDSEKNDIYIHMDKKVKYFNKHDIKNKVKKSRIFFADKIKCSWGGLSLVKAELNLLEYATKNNYRYYHLISGQDLPTKKQNEIYDYFKENYGKQYVDFQQERFTFEKRVKYYYFFQEMLGRKVKNRIFRLFRKISVEIQNIIRINRNNNIAFQKGSQWFSITDDFAKYIISKEKEIKRIFKNTYCPDEMFIQTILVNSKFKDKLYSNEINKTAYTTKRYINWDKGNPYVWKKENFEELINSEALFARKFDESVDKEIITLIKKYLTRGE